MIGSDSLDISNVSNRLSIQVKVVKSINNVLLAFVTSVTCWSVNLYRSHESIVPKHRSLSFLAS